MQIIKHGDLNNISPWKPTCKFECPECGCEWIAVGDEYIVKDIDSFLRAKNITVAECTCPECGETEVRTDFASTLI